MSQKDNFGSIQEIDDEIGRILPLETEAANSGRNEEAHWLGKEIIRLQELKKSF